MKKAIQLSLKIIFSFLLMAITFSAIAQTGNNKLVIRVIDSIQSKILNEQCKIYVQVPNIKRSIFK